MSNYDQMTNEELVVLVSAGKDENAFSELDRRFSRFIFFKARKYRDVNGLTHEDILQEGNIALYKAALAFDPEKGFRFSSFFDSFLHIHYRRIFFERNLRKKDPMCRCTPIEYYDLDMEYDCMVSDIACSDVERTVMDRERHDALMRSVEKSLSDTERNVVLAYLGGSDYRTIAAKLGISEKSVDNALTRAKKKLKGDLGGFGSRG